MRTMTTWPLVWATTLLCPGSATSIVPPTVHRRIDFSTRMGSVSRTTTCIGEAQRIGVWGTQGCPVMPHETEWFLEMLGRTRQNLTDEQLAQVSAALETFAKPYRR